MTWRQIELLHVQLNYPHEELLEFSRALDGVDPAEVFVIVPGAEPFGLRMAVSRAGVSVFEEMQLEHLADQEIFVAQIPVDMTEGAHIRLPSGRLPLPKTVTAAYRLHLRVEHVPLATYVRGDAIEVFSGISTTDGEKQLSFVAQLQADGSRKISVDFAPALPKRTRV